MTLRILVAEDDFINQQIALSLLKNIGYHADLAENGCQVLIALEKQAYDVILMDVHMPEMDGLEATQRIIQRYAHNRPFIIALTSVQQCKCEAAGMDAYLSKPLEMDVLQKLLDTHTKSKLQKTKCDTKKQSKIQHVFATVPQCF